MSNNNGPVLVIGATGQQGRATTRALLEKGQQVRAFVRDPESTAAKALQAQGAELVVGDLDDEAGVKDAMDGSRSVFLMLTMMEGVNITEAGIAAEQRRGETVIDLARDSGIEHLVYSSLRGAGQNSGVEYYAAKEHLEAYLTAQRVPATILRPVFFMDNFASFNRPVLDDSGTLVLNLAVREDIPLSLISVRDIGAFAALALTHPEEYLGRTVSIAGDRLTPPQIARTFGLAAGRPARSFQVPIEAVRAFDAQVAKMFTFFNERPDEALDLTALRVQHPGLQDLPTWLATSGWRP
ncbi:NmrA/HSCARG family protein [Nocardia sp. NPDC058640]|uniref:NmrA/HSCARG family protein n=1 Tax=Nocardia sp. NPDC058640 TaxID=3346571 RepID=UPI0036561D37